MLNSGSCPQPLDWFTVLTQTQSSHLTICIAPLFPGSFLPRVQKPEVSLEVSRVSEHHELGHSRHWNLCIKAAVTLTCIFREEADVVGGGKARSANSSSGSRTCGSREEQRQLHGDLRLWVPWLSGDGSHKPKAPAPPWPQPSPCSEHCGSGFVVALAGVECAHTQGQSPSLHPDQQQSRPAVHQREQVVRDQQAQAVTQTQSSALTSS